MDWSHTEVVKAFSGSHEPPCAVLGLSIFNFPARMLGLQEVARDVPPMV